MNKGDCLTKLDDLHVAAWEMRDLIDRTARNETWTMVHKSPPKLVADCVEKSDSMCERFTKRLVDYEELIYAGMITDYDKVVDEMVEEATVNAMRYQKLYERLSEYAMFYTYNARFRKSFIRR